MGKPQNLTAEQATQDAEQAIEAAGHAGVLSTDGMDAFRVTSQPVSMPRSLGDAVLTTVRVCGPLADVPAVAAALRALPGVIQVSTLPGCVAVYRGRAA